MINFHLPDKFEPEFNEELFKELAQDNAAKEKRLGRQFLALIAVAIIGVVLTAFSIYQTNEVSVLKSGQAKQAERISTLETLLSQHHQLLQTLEREIVSLKSNSDSLSSLLSRRAPK